MSVIIATNIASLQAQKTLGSTQDSLAQTINRLSTGHRINSAKDDAAGKAIVEIMTSEIRGLNQGARNGNDGISLIQTAESGLNQILSLTQRMRELSIQAASGTYSTANLANLDTEYQALLAQVDRVAATVDFNGTVLLNATVTSVDVQTGPSDTSNDQITVDLIDATTATLAISGGDLTSNANATTALGLLTTAITTITTGLATLGAAQSNMEAVVAGNIDRSTSLQAARSRILDTDFADESAKLAQYQILQQSATAMLAQANTQGQVVLKLLQ